MSKALSVELRDRVIAAIEGGMSCHQAVPRFGVSASSAIRWRSRVRTQGDALAGLRRAPGRQTNFHVALKIGVEEIVGTNFSSVSPSSRRAEAVGLWTRVPQKAIAALGGDLSVEEGRAHTPFQLAGVGGTAVLPRLNQSLGAAAGQRIDA